MHLFFPQKFCSSIVFNFYSTSNLVGRVAENPGNEVAVPGEILIMHNFWGQKRCIMGDLQMANNWSPV